MIGLDTNLLVRLLVLDDEEQVARVRALLDRCHENGTRCLLTIVVLCELEWVLATSYEVSREEIALAVRRFVADELFEVEEQQVVQQALDDYGRGRGDLSDYLLAARGHALGAMTTFTFDKALRDCERFTLL